MTGKVNELNVVNESQSGPTAVMVFRGAGARMDLTLFNITRDAVLARQRKNMPCPPGTQMGGSGEAVNGLRSGT